jgi:hypothetical protein
MHTIKFLGVSPLPCAMALTARKEMQTSRFLKKKWSGDHDIITPDMFHGLCRSDGMKDDGS